MPCNNFILHCKEDSIYVFQKWNCTATFPISTFMYLWAISQKHECGNWERGHEVSFLGIFVSNFWYSVFAVCPSSLAVSIGLSPRCESHQILDEYYSPPHPSPPHPSPPSPPLPDYQHQWFPDEIPTSSREPAPSGLGSQQFLYRVKTLLVSRSRIIILHREFLINSLIFLHVWIW